MTRPSVDAHAARIAELLRPALESRRVETVRLDAALGRVTAVDVASPVDLPLFRNSQMDGFALRAADIRHVPARLRVIGEIAAGSSALDLGGASGEAVRIMTGAPVPNSADVVVPVEDTTTESDSGGEWVIVRASRSAGDFVRERGSDIRAGEFLLAAGVRLASRHLGALAAAGVTTVDVRGRLRVALITTGSELIAPGAEPRAGQVFDSSGTALDAAVRAAGAEVASRTHIVDDPERMDAGLAAAALAADLIVTTGGISMGAYEVVRQTLEPRGADVVTLAMQPGGPQATALFDGVPVVCLPGNPVSSQVSFEVFVAPLLRGHAGLPVAERGSSPLAHALTSVPGRRQFLRGRRLASGSVEPVSGPGSHLVAGMAAADLLIVVPEDVVDLSAGESVETWAL